MTTLTTKQRDRLAAAVSVAFGLSLAWLCVGQLRAPVSAARQAAPRTGLKLQRPAVKAEPTLPAPSVRQVAVQTVSAPATKHKKATPPKPTPVAAEEAAANPVRIETPAYSFLAQPSAPVEVHPVRDELPLLAGATPDGLPPLPAADYVPPAVEYLETPGGEVLVLGLLVDSEGRVLDTRILVPSHNGLGDISYAMVAQRERITNIQPPIEAGQPRWLEVRVFFPLPKTGALP